jgi:hypothetical protein
MTRRHRRAERDPGRDEGAVQPALLAGPDAAAPEGDRRGDPDRHNVRFTIEWYVSGEPFYTQPGPLSDAVTQAVREVTGRAPKLSTGGGTSDGRFIATLGTQVVELGVTNRSIHKVNESVRSRRSTPCTPCTCGCWSACWPEAVRPERRHLLAPAGGACGSPPPFAEDADPRARAPTPAPSRASTGPGRCQSTFAHSPIR